MSINKNLRDQILKMAKLDQLIRKKQWRELKILNQKFPDKNDPVYKQKINKFVAQLKKIDSKHTEKMRKIIKKFGWPGKSLVGKHVVHMAWLLVQHADQHVPFQEYCLKILKNAVKHKEAEPRHVAFLTDRILTHQGKKQIYGTQFQREKNGKLVPFPIKDIKNIDKRRKQAGIELFSVYVKKMGASMK